MSPLAHFAGVLGVVAVACVTACASLPPPPEPPKTVHDLKAVLDDTCKAARAVCNLQALSPIPVPERDRETCADVYAYCREATP